MRTNRHLLIFAILVTLTSCAPKTSVQPLPETPFTKAARAADDIAGGIKLLVAAETNLEKQRLISPQEGLKVIDAIAVLNKANVTFTNDVETAKATGSKSALSASGKAVIRAVGGLTGLTIKNEKAKQTFDGIMATVSIAVAVVQSFVE